MVNTKGCGIDIFLFYIFHSFTPHSTSTLISSGYLRFEGAGTTLKFLFDASNIDSEVNASNAIIQVWRQPKINAAIELDFSNVDVSAFAESGTYYVPIISYTNPEYDNQINIDTLNKQIDASLLADGVEFLGVDRYSDAANSDYGYYAKLNITVPEPSTYAAIFGALALAFVAYRRRK